MFDQQTDSRPVIVCLHGSASDPGMWHDLREATVIWETSGAWPVVAPTLGRADASEWIEAEALWSDGRRAFAALEVTSGR